MASLSSSESPWRRVFEDLRVLVGSARDEDGVVGSINWLRKQMTLRGANPNVVRNVIYRDKGKLNDKRVLFDIIKELYTTYSQTPLQVPELEALFAASSSAEQEVAQLLGREKRRAYSAFVSAVRAGQAAKLIVTGKPGSGKTLLLDYIQQALDLPPLLPHKALRLEFSSSDLSASLGQLGQQLGLPSGDIEAKLVKVATAGAFAVQADAQADVARVILEGVKSPADPFILMFHLSQGLNESYELGATSLRLNTPDVPRVSAAEWLWHSLFIPMSRMPHVSLLISAVSVPVSPVDMAAFEGPIKLSPPTTAEARRFVKARLPQLAGSRQEALVQKAGRSYEELRTLTLLEETRAYSVSEVNDVKYIEQLSHLLETSGDKRLRDFLTALAVVSLPEYLSFELNALLALRHEQWRSLSTTEQAFLDAVPGQENVYRCFSRQLSRQLRQYFKQTNPEAFQDLNSQAATFYETFAAEDASSEEAARYLYHLFEARDWRALKLWLRAATMPQALLRRLWEAAELELAGGDIFEEIAFQVAAHYVRLGSYTHPDALKAFDLLATSEKPEVRSWTLVKRVEGAVLKGQIDDAVKELEAWEVADDAILNVEYNLLRASILRWQSNLEEAAAWVEKARPLLATISQDESSGRLIHAKVALWAGLVAKDKGDLSKALEEFKSIQFSDDLIESRLAFQIGDVQMRLGQFKQALASFNFAIVRSERSEALRQEQTRYLTRRGSLHRKRGEFIQAKKDFETALALLQESEQRGLEQTFLLAKVNDEYALYHLAVADFDKAITLLARSQAVFLHYQSEQRIDASYRYLRSKFRLALAYAARATGQAYRLPLLISFKHCAKAADLSQARQLAKESLKQLKTVAKNQSNYTALLRRGLLITAWLGAEPPQVLLKEALKVSGDSYLEAETKAYSARTYFEESSFSDAKTVLADAEKAWQTSQEKLEDGDLALFICLRVLKMNLLIKTGDEKTSVSLLRELLEDANLARYHESLLVNFASLFEEGRTSAAEHPLIKPLITVPYQNLRLADSLRLNYAALKNKPVEQV